MTSPILAHKFSSAWRFARSSCSYLPLIGMILNLHLCFSFCPRPFQEFSREYLSRFPTEQNLEFGRHSVIWVAASAASAAWPVALVSRRGGRGRRRGASPWWGGGRSPGDGRTGRDGRGT